jgi:hypothetical protein
VRQTTTSLDHVNNAAVLASKEAENKAAADAYVATVRVHFVVPTHLSFFFSVFFQLFEGVDVVVLAVAFVVV